MKDAAAAAAPAGGAGAVGEAAAAVQAAAAAEAAWPPASERLAAVAERIRALPRGPFPAVSDRAAAAVLVGLFEDEGGLVRVLLTQRSSRLKSHRGEVCLPGGKRDEADGGDDAATALREAHEELGVDPSRVSVLGYLPPVLSKHHLSVTPVLALVPPDTVPRPHPDEVAAAFTVPLAVFLGQLSDPRAGAPGPSGAGAGTGAGAGAPELDRNRASRRKRGAAAAAVAAPAPAEPMTWWSMDEADGAAPVAAAPKARGQVDASRSGRDGPISQDCSYGTAEHTFRDIQWDEQMYRIHSFQWGSFDVWGLTATICIAAAQAALGRAPSFQERCPGGQHYSCFYWDGSRVRARKPEGAETEGSRKAVRGAEAAGGEGLQTTAALEAGAGDGAGDLVLPSREEVAAAPDVAVEAVEAEVVAAAAAQ